MTHKAAQGPRFALVCGVCLQRIEAERQRETAFRAELAGAEIHPRP